MSEDRTVTVVIPALDEERTIGRVVSDVLEHATEVVVVDDGSTDATARIARENGAVVISHERNRGYDESLSDGFAHAIERGADIVVTFDADGQHRAAEIPRVVAPIKEGQAGIVVGRRPEPARFAEAVFAGYTKHRLGIDDPLSGFKAYDADIYREVGYFDQYDSIGTHLMFAAAHRGYDIRQVDIGVENREDEPRFGHLRANLTMISALASIVRFDLTSSLRGAISRADSS